MGMTLFYVRIFLVFFLGGFCVGFVDLLCFMRGFWGMGVFGGGVLMVGCGGLRG
jgi:hypothetical protein